MRARPGCPVGKDPSASTPPPPPALDDPRPLAGSEATAKLRRRPRKSLGAVRSHIKDLCSHPGCVSTWKYQGRLERLRPSCWSGRIRGVGPRRSELTWRGSGRCLSRGVAWPSDRGMKRSPPSATRRLGTKMWRGAGRPSTDPAEGWPARSCPGRDENSCLFLAGHALIIDDAGAGADDGDDQRPQPGQSEAQGRGRAEGTPAPRVHSKEGIQADAADIDSDRLVDHVGDDAPRDDDPLDRAGLAGASSVRPDISAPAAGNCIDVQEQERLEGSVANFSRSGSRCQWPDVIDAYEPGVSECQRG